MLKLKNLFVEYEGSSIPALNNVTMNIPKGKITALVGESGSGKTTLANSILASLPEDTRVEGSICDSKNRHVELAYGKDVSFVSQRFASSLSEYFTIYSQFDMLIRSKMRLKKKDRKKIISTLLSRFISDAEDKMRKYPFQLSGGEKQRILIAMAVAGNPQLLIADEPTSAIDTATRASLMKDLQKQNQERNTTMLVISHDLALVQNIADNIVVLYKGMIMESGSSAIMKNKPRHPYSKLLLSSRPDMKKKNLSEKKILNNSNGNECPFAPYCPEFEQNCKLVVNNGNQGSYCACSRAL